MISENRFLSQIISILSLTTGPTNRVSLNTNPSFFKFRWFLFHWSEFFKEEINQICQQFQNQLLYSLWIPWFRLILRFSGELTHFPSVFINSFNFTRAFLPLASSVSWYISNTSLSSCNFFQNLEKFWDLNIPSKFIFFVSRLFRQLRDNGVNVL